MLQKEIFLLFYFPDSQFCGFVDIMLIKQRQNKIVDFRLHPPKNNFIWAGIYDLFAEYCRHGIQEVQVSDTDIHRHRTTKVEQR